MVLHPERLAICEQQGLCDLLEVFSSIQGEGPRVGERHLFVRLAQCDIQCAYCDTPLCHGVHARARVERTPGQGDFVSVENPVPVQSLRGAVEGLLAATPHRAVSLTGGEPLLQPWVIEALSPMIRASGARVLLETDGNLPDAYERVRGSIDILSMDWKAPSATGEPARYDEHRRVLGLSGSAEAWVKLVYVAETPEEEVALAARAVADVRSDVPFILQPCTPFARVRTAPSSDLGLRLVSVAAQHLSDVRLIPQVHKMLDVL